MREDTFALPCKPGRAAPTSAASPTRSRSTSTSPRKCFALARAARARRCTAIRRRPAVSPEEHAERRPLRRAGCRAVRRRRLHGAAHGRVARAALAQRRLRRRTARRRGELVRRRADVTEVAQVVRVGAARRPARCRPRAARRREHFTGRDDLVFCRRGRRLPRRLGAPPPLRTRAAAPRASDRCVSTTCATRSAASSSASSTSLSVKAFMGHAKITTTERYLHARPRRDDAARMTKVFDASVSEAPARELER